MSNTNYENALQTIRRPFLLSRCQAKYRKEEWNLTYEEFCTLWADHYLERGRDGHNYVMTRKDVLKAWDINNILVLTRLEQNQLLGSRTREKRRNG